MLDLFSSYGFVLLTLSFKYQLSQMLNDYGYYSGWKWWNFFEPFALFMLLVSDLFIALLILFLCLPYLGRIWVISLFVDLFAFKFMNTMCVL